MKKYSITLIALIACISLAGCKSANSINSNMETTETAVSADTNIFTERDLKQTADTENSTAITIEDGKDIDITTEGVYVLSGSGAEVTISVNAPDTAKVQLVLDGVDITNTSEPVISIISADKCFITLTDSKSSLSVTGEYTTDGKAVIYSKDDLTFNGTGTLDISSAYGGGIDGKDDVKLTGGTYNITAAGKGIEANDRAAICGGTIAVTAGEGIEATYVRIDDGSITINASDDGINASSKSSKYTPSVEFNGGYTRITVGQGDTDAVDSNGAVIINGGTVDITSTISSFDCDTTAELNGGTLIINGTEVNEIPQPMMGGRGGMGGIPQGEMPRGGMPPRGERPDGGRMPQMQ